MSQKSKDFQPKTKKFSGAARSAGRPAGRKFDNKFEGDKGSRGTDRPRRSFARDDRSSEPRGARPARDGGYEKRSRSFDKGDSRSSERRPSRPYEKREPRSYEGRESRPPRRESSERSGSFDRPKRSFSRDDRPARPAREGGYEKRPRSYEGRESKPYEKREFDRPKRSFERDERPSRAAAPEGREPRSYEGRESRPTRKAPPGRDRFEQKSYTRYDDKRGAPKKFDSKKRPPRRYEESEPAVEASAETRQRLKSERQTFGAPSSAFLYGVHAVTEALKNPKRLHQRLLCTEKGFESIQAVFQEGLDAGLKMPKVSYLEREDIERLLPRDAVHQEILLDCQPLEEVFLVDILLSMPENATVLVLDQVTDPHNVGAIIRSAAAFGASAVIAQKLHAPEITGTLAKSASGAVEHVPLVREVNLSRTLDTLKESGFQCIGLDERGEKTLAEVARQGKTAIVLGAEGDGIRRLVSEHCDTLARLPTQGEIASLNVSNAAAIALYECSRSRK